MFVINGCDNTKINIPSEEIDGYVIGEYDVYKKAAKENGKKYDKLYVIGKYCEDPFEADGLYCSYFVDINNKKYLLKIDSQKTENKEQCKALKDKQICVCGIYGGSLIKEPMPVIYVNKIYDIKEQKTITSQYYGEYYGDFDENGKVISTDYDKEDNTDIDFHSLQIQVPYNYKESELSSNFGLYYIQEDGVFFIIYVNGNLSDTLSNYKTKNTVINKMKNPLTIEEMYNTILQNFNVSNLKASNIKDDTYNCTVSCDINNNDMFGNGMIVFKNDGIYILTLLSESKSRFNRSQDFSKIVKSIKILSPARQPKSAGVKKMTVPKNNTSKAEDKPKTNVPKETSKHVEAKANNNVSNSGINSVVDEYKKDIDDAKSQLNDEIDKVAEQVKDEMGLAGDLFGGYIDKYSDAYKKAIDTVGDTYKDVADDYGKVYKDILNSFGY